MPGKPPVEFGRECLAFSLTERGRAAADFTHAPQFLVHVPYGEALSHVRFGVAPAPGIQCGGAARDHIGGKRNVCGDHQVTGRDPLRDVVIRFIETAGDLHCTKVLRYGGFHRVVCYEGKGQSNALGGTKQYVLDDPGARIGVHPDAGVLAQLAVGIAVQTASEVTARTWVPATWRGK